MLKKFGTMVYFSLLAPHSHVSQSKKESPAPPEVGRPFSYRHRTSEAKPRRPMSIPESVGLVSGFADRFPPDSEA